ncbi:uncharacterized protein K452DRAFT_242078 [Aplosporella prunicola CBS 121167]|uniref:GED domain-containing protein n=1 Tax=Aplosporella prunicola CBS 121167 TaxID=1176127 RepID=A0A6A6BS18_9PEZI|nr:uncharacterized protein K452DRAFT_242078 [Aplosporella prunicola CBS 121167]KAF2146892.1 hypothetical protein K452DRAFT_242078 [Aplosporella prunicola CBS 121167]
MADNSLNPIALRELHSKDQGQLLDDIDRLRSQGVSNYIDLPQLIVCGDQSSGKSSVLEAISLVRFPTKDHLCTRFATELVLRRTSNVHAAVTIKPGPSRSEADRARLLEFNEPFTSGDDLPNLIESAKKFMGLSLHSFSEDVLRVESSGPDRPHLTIVDLPGLIHANGRQQSTVEINNVSKMVKGYMSNPRSIILAVVSAQTDFSNQIVTRLAREVDPNGTRTLGIITKPDIPPRGSDSEKAWIGVAKNEEVDFRLGWHVLKNRDYDSQGASSAERDQKESQFFSQGAWSELPRESVGISALRTRLNKVFLQHICSDLPAVVKEIMAELRQCEQTLSKLGDPRPTAKEQRTYLTYISQTFQHLTKVAADGTYNDTFFRQTNVPGGDTKRLRAVVRNLNDEFADEMQRRGHYLQILPEDGQPYAFVTTPGTGGTVSRQDYLNEIQGMARRNRGCELPGTLSSLLTTDLFHQQSQPWEDIAAQHLDKVWASTKVFLELVMEHVASSESSEILLRGFIDPLMENRLKIIQEKLAEVLRPYKHGALITLNRHYAGTVEAVRFGRTRAKMVGTLNNYLDGGSKAGNFTMEDVADDLLSSDGEQRMFAETCSDILDRMEAYYETALNVFVDNVAALVIENCLLSELPELFSPAIVAGMDDEQLEVLAAESQQVTAERAQLNRKISVLKEGLRTCRKHVPREQQTIPQRFSTVKKQNSNTSSSPETTAASITSELNSSRLTNNTSTSSAGSSRRSSPNGSIFDEASNSSTTGTSSASTASSAPSPRVTSFSVPGLNEELLKKKSTAGEL